MANKSWRVAGSIDQLIIEIHAISPETTCYTIDNTPDIDSDHDPNPDGVVCAGDIMQGHGLNLAAVAEQVRKRENRCLKYVIYNRRIASAASNPPWSWRAYRGDNPHMDHVHVSVGTGGPDGYSKPPYDDRTPWGIAAITNGGSNDMYCDYGNKDSENVRVLQMQLNQAYDEKLTVDGWYLTDTAAAMARHGMQGVNGDGHRYGSGEYVTLQAALMQKYAGKPGDKGDAAVLAPGTILHVVSTDA